MNSMLDDNRGQARDQGRGIVRTVSWRRVAALASAVAMVAAVAVHGCDDSAWVSCENGRLCPPDWTCSLIQDVCIAPGACGNRERDPGEVCDDGNVDDTDSCSARCLNVQIACGNGVLEEREACDDGNNTSGDGCSGDCLSTEICGNGYTDIVAGESCDDGNDNIGDGCSFCVTDACGDDILSVGEVCDDGNTESCDGCSANCQSREDCGNGIVDACVGEICDDLGESAACNVDCTLARCGDALVNNTAGEQCDDGNTVSGDGCDAACQSE